MNNYHIYEAIGNGKHSAVYKGRKKKTIEYYAIKSVDKSQRPKVLREVRMLHPLNHPNILKFFAWYETNAHLWLILEYCVGGDLRKLLDTDGKLHESSIHDLGLNLVLALQYLHSEGIIFCDLKPSNILMDEFGRVKLCDFGLSRRLIDMDKNSPMAMQGTPYYMAPELFHENGAHSYASDFWALGCILYECYTGKPPFYQKELTKLVNSIISDPTPTLPDFPSKSFQNLIESLLIKDPNERLQWPDICNHSFWKIKLDIFNPNKNRAPPVSLERNSENTPNPRQRNPARQNSQGKDENTPNQKGFNTPTKNNSQISKRVIRPPNQNQKGVNILRISRAAKLNLQREKEKVNYRAEKTEIDAEVKLENKDMELNFSENLPEEEEESDDPSENPNPNSDESALPQDGNNNEQNEAIDILTNETASDISDLISTPPAQPPAGSPSSTPQKGEKVISQSNPNPNSSKEPASVFWHASDLSVKPVMPGRKISEKSYDISCLPFEAINPNDYTKLPQEKLDGLNSKIVRVLSGTSQVSEKQNVLKYLEMLSWHSEAANILTNGPVMLSLVKILRLSKSLILKVQVATLVGLLIRHSTEIEINLANSGIMIALTNGLRDKQDRLRRFCMASLGELLFYISTLNDHDSGASATWQVPSALIALISSLLGKGEDDLAQLYALRTIDNVATRGELWTTRFASHDVISNLARIYKSPTKQETTRLVAGSCLVRLARFSPICVQFIFERLNVKEIVGTVLKGESKEQQIGVNLVNLGFVSGSVQNFRVLVGEFEKQMVPGVISVLEQGSEVLRGKTLIFCGLLCKSSKRWLLQFICNGKFLSAVDRLGKENCEFVQDCFESFVDLIVDLIPSVIETIFGEIQMLIGAKRQQFTGRIQNPKNTMNLFPLILHLLSSLSFKNRVVSSRVMVQLADLSKLFETPFPGRDDIQITLLRILESISEEPTFIINYHKIFTAQILPSLCKLYRGNKDDNARFLCLKILMDIMIMICNDTQLTAELETTADLKNISQTLFLPLYPVMVKEEDPIPLYAQKLLVMLIEFGYVKVSEILHLRTVDQCFRFLDADLANVNVSNVKLCLALVSAQEMDVRILRELKVVRKIGNLLGFLMSKGMDDFLEPTLGLCKAFILCAVGRNKGERILAEPKLSCDNSFDIQPYNSINDIGDFGMNVGNFLELCGSSDREIADVSSSCVVLLVRAAPRDGTIGILTNLHKIGSLMRDLCEIGSVLCLVRVIYALGFSCEQYLSHAMILSIPVPALVQLQNFVLGLKSYDLMEVSKAADYLSGELERLPHCA